MTPHPKYPGIFVEEVPTGMRTIDGVSTSVTAFVGAASRGRSYRAVRINSFRKFEQRFGGLVSNYDLGYAVQQFFLNGGKTLGSCVWRGSSPPPRLSKASTRSMPWTFSICW